MRGRRLFIGQVGDYFLYEMRRNGAKVISVQNAQDEEIMAARDEKTAREWIAQRAHK